MVLLVFKSTEMVHIVAFMHKVLVEIIFSMDKVFDKTFHPRRVSVITSYGFIWNKICENIQNY